MRTVFGAVLMVLGVAFGLYVGVWFCFIGGIIDVITEVRAEELSAMAVAIGVAKVIFAGLAGYISAALLIFHGYLMVKQ